METISLVQIALQVLGIAALIYASWLGLRRLQRRRQRRQEGLQFDKRCRSLPKRATVTGAQVATEQLARLTKLVEVAGKSSPRSSKATATHLGQPNTSGISSSASSPASRVGTPKP